MIDSPTATAKHPALPTDVLFRAISYSRRSEAIVGQIRDLIRTAQLRPGDQLPGEHNLSSSMGVSRGTVREAMHVLQAAGLIEIRVGARGGAFVTAPSSKKVGADLADMISLSGFTAAEVTEVRQAIELGIIPLVVARTTDADIAELRSMLDDHMVALRDGVYGLAMSAAFHVRVAACTHNSAVETLVQSFHGPLLMSMREAQLASPSMGSRGSLEHSAFVDALEARDAERAAGIMQTHLARTARRVGWVSRQRAEQDGGVA